MCALSCLWSGRNYHGVVLYHWPPDEIIPNIAVIHCLILNSEKEGTAVNYHGIFITLASDEIMPNTSVIYCLI
jgi:hypothetical protein